VGLPTPGRGRRLPALVLVAALAVVVLGAWAASAMRGQRRAVAGAPSTVAVSPISLPAATPTPSAGAAERPSPDASPSPVLSPLPQVSPRDLVAQAPSKAPGRPSPSGATSATPSHPPCWYPSGAPTVDTISVPKVKDVDYVTAMAVAPDGRLFYTERSGRIWVFQGGSAQLFADVTTQVSMDGERGLVGLALSPGFATNHQVFAFYSIMPQSQDPADENYQRVVRFTDCGGVGVAATTVIDNLPAQVPGMASCCHKGGRIAFDPNGYLYVTIGDNFRWADQAQDPQSLRGKVLRYTAAGQPAGISAGSPVWIYGLRNPFGLAFAPDGAMAITNNGPSEDAGSPCVSCGDEFYLVGTAGDVGYQWPFCWGYSHPISPNTDCHGLLEPSYSTEDCTSYTGTCNPEIPASPTYFIGPTGVAWISSGAYAGHFLFCAFRDTGQVYEYVKLRDVQPTSMGSCQFDVKQEVDGSIWTADASGLHRH
jgi:glucose/arabinose dehydrogenase